jgi:regulator of sigma E protease
MRYLESLALLSLLVLIHELGHLWAAKWAGIPVAGFSVGFGPKLWSFRRGGTEYAFRLLPLGGYVLPAAESYEEFQEIPLIRRLAFYLGGPLANLAAAVPLLSLLNAEHGATGFRALVLAPFVQAATSGYQGLAALPAQLASFQQLQGMVGIVHTGGQAVAQGHLVELALGLTLSFALLNLLPIPILDGGKIFLALLEKVVPASRRLQVPLTAASALFLLATMVYLNSKDTITLLG